MWVISFNLHVLLVIQIKQLKAIYKVNWNTKDSFLIYFEPLIMSSMKRTFFVLLFMVLINHNFALALRVKYNSLYTQRYGYLNISNPNEK